MIQRLIDFFRKQLVEPFPYPDKCFDCRRPSCEGCEQACMPMHKDNADSACAHGTESRIAAPGKEAV